MDQDRSAPESFTVVTCTALLHRPIDQAWQRIGGFDDLDCYLDVSCCMLSGTGEVGSVRAVGDGIVEPLVARTRYSYTYAQTVGPMAAFHYHGTVAVDAEGDGCRLTYTLVYDPSDMGADRRTGEQDRIQKRFDGAVAAMKRAAEADA